MEAAGEATLGGSRGVPRVSGAGETLDYSLFVGANFITSNSLKFRNPASSSYQITRNGTVGSYGLGDVMVMSWFWMWRQ